MSNTFNTAEVIAMGIEKEKRRRDFYAMVAEEFSDNEQMRNLFSNLKNWEEAHIRKFSEIQSNLKENVTRDRYEGELASYMEALVDDSLYSDITPASFRSRVKDMKTAIRIGLGFEKDAILFFRELLPCVKSPFAEAIEELIDEEKQHILFLRNLEKLLD